MLYGFINDARDNKISHSLPYHWTQRHTPCVYCYYINVVPPGEATQSEQDIMGK